MKTILEDIKTVVKPLWLILLLQLLVMYAFWGVPQGVDVLYCIIEDFSTIFKSEKLWADAKIIPFVAVLMALFYWSLVSEFCSRLIIYLSDFSSENLSVEKKYRRYYLTKNLPKLFFYLPTAVLFCGFVHSFYLKQSDIEWTRIEWLNLLSLLIIELCLLLLVYVLYQLRFGKWNKRYKKPIVAYLDIVKLVGLTGVLEHYPGNEKALIKKYKPLFVIFLRLFFVALLSMILFIFLPTGFFEKVGATAFICMGFACWIMVYTIIEWITRRGIRGVQIPLKTILVGYILIVSYKNNDHPFRIIKETKSDSCQTLDAYYTQWLADRKNLFAGRDTISPIFIAAEGGALRTGCFSAMTLAAIQDSFPEFKDRIFCFSSVSGGTIGTAFFNALCQQNIKDKSYQEVTKAFFEYDFLAPVTAKITFGEPFNWMWYDNIEKCDRVIALEKSWEASWQNLALKDKKFWAKGFQSNYTAYTKMPAHFINTTEVENGRRAIIAPISIDSNIFTNATDLMRFIRIEDDIPYSTAAGLSSRFPFLSPAGFYNYCDRNKSRHYVDGGYYENKGDITLLEIIKHITNHSQGYVIKPIVIQMSFAEDNDRSNSIAFMNEVQEIVLAMYNTRVGRTKVANKELQKYLYNLSDRGVYVNLYLPDDVKKVPMNWVLSNNALDHIQKSCKNIIHSNVLNEAIPYFHQ